MPSKRPPARACERQGPALKKCPGAMRQATPGLLKYVYPYPSPVQPGKYPSLAPRYFLTNLWTVELTVSATQMSPFALTAIMWASPNSPSPWPDDSALQRSGSAAAPAAPSAATGC